MKDQSIRKCIIFILLITGISAWSPIFGQVLTHGQVVDIVTVKVDPVAEISTNGASVIMTLTTTVPGQGVVTVTNSDIWVRITSVLPLWFLRRRIYARLDTPLPPGTVLTIKPNSATTVHGTGTLGTPISSPITLNYNDQTIVSGIGSCSTGTAPGDGYRINLTWKSGTYSQIRATTGQTVTIVFTISIAWLGY